MRDCIYAELKSIKPKIPRKTYRTIAGQIKAGDREGAAAGIGRLKERIAKEAANEKRG